LMIRMVMVAPSSILVMTVLGLVHGWVVQFWTRGRRGVFVYVSAWHSSVGFSMGEWMSQREFMGLPCVGSPSGLVSDLRVVTVLYHGSWMRRTSESSVWRIKWMCALLHWVLMDYILICCTAMIRRPPLRGLQWGLCVGRTLLLGMWRAEGG